MSKFSIFYAGLAAVLIGLYAWSTATGQEYFHPGKEKATAEHKAKGYRGTSFIFIHTGGRGGK
jgi:hypothetical protein